MITRQFLESNPNDVFVFGDNQRRRGRGGAAALRDLPNTYGFITKKKPTNEDDAFFTTEDYRPVFEEELAKLEEEIKSNPDVTFHLSRFGAGLANRHGIYQAVCKGPRAKLAALYPNVVLA